MPNPNLNNPSKDLLEAPPCPICVHEDSASLDEQLLEGSLSQTDVAKMLGIPRQLVWGHVHRHLREELEADGGGKRETLLASLSYLEEKTEQILARCLKKGLLETALKALTRREAQVKLIAEITGALQEKSENVQDQDKKVKQLEQAIQGLITRARQEGLTISYKEAAQEIIRLEPEYKKYLKANWDLDSSPSQLAGEIN